MSKSTLGEELIAAVEQALTAKTRGRVLRSSVDVAAIRHTLGLTQRQFAKQYHINLETLRNWEQRNRIPDATSVAYLTCISKKPDVIRKLLNV